MGSSIGSSTPYFAASLAAMPPPLPMPYGVTQPFLTLSVPPPLVGGAPPYGDQNLRAVTLALRGSILPKMGDVEKQKSLGKLLERC